MPYSRTFARVLATALVLGSLFATTKASAQDPREEPWWFKFDGGVAFPISRPHRDIFGLGAAGGAAVYRGLLPELQLGFRASGGFLTDDGHGGTLRFGTLTGVARIRPWPDLDLGRRGTGPWVEAGIGGALLNERARLLFEGAFGWNFPLGAIGLGPFFRIQHFHETANRFDGSRREVFLGQVGLEFTLGDGFRRLRDLGGGGETTELDD